MTMHDPLLERPLIHTRHSLGRVKRSRFLASDFPDAQIEKRFNMRRRIKAEETTLASAQRVITSTHQEIKKQYELYDYYQPDQMRVIPQGDLSYAGADCRYCLGAAYQLSVVSAAIEKHSGRFPEAETSAETGAEALQVELLH